MGAKLEGFENKLARGNIDNKSELEFIRNQVAEAEATFIDVADNYWKTNAQIVRNNNEITGMLDLAKAQKERDATVTELPEPEPEAPEIQKVESEISVENTSMEQDAVPVTPRADSSKPVPEPIENEAAKEMEANYVVELSDDEQELTSEVVDVESQVVNVEMGQIEIPESTAMRAKLGATDGPETKGVAVKGETEDTLGL